MKSSTKLVLWLMLAAAAVLSSSCAPLAMTPPQPAAQTAPLSAAADSEIVINIAPTPGAVDPAGGEITPAPPEPTIPSRATVAPGAPSGSGCRSGGEVVRGKWPSKVFGGPHDYAIYLPPCYDEENNTARYPVIYLFHGWPMDENHWLNLGIASAAARLINSGELPPFIIALPRGDTEGVYNRTSGGDNSWEAAMIDEFIPYIDRTYRTLRQRDDRAIGGISRGGVWALEIAFRHPDLFASVGAHSAALSVNNAAAGFDPMDLAVTAPIESMRIFIDAGDKDWTRDSARALSKLLDARYIPHTYTIGSGEHVDAYWRSQVDAYLKFYAAPWKAEKLVQQQLNSSAQ